LAEAHLIQASLYEQFLVTDADYSVNNTQNTPVKDGIQTVAYAGNLTTVSLGRVIL